MKKNNLFLVLCICALAFFSTKEAYAKNEVTFYAKVKAQVSSSSTNMGKVYAGTANSADTYATPSSTSGELNSGQKESGTSSADVGPFYVFAEPNNGYVFEGWKESDDANADWYSRDNSCSITVTSTNQSEGGYTKTLYAFFAEKKKVTVTMPTTVNGSYSYSCTDGNGTVNTTTSQTIITDAEITFTATPISGYKFFGWYTLDGSTETFLNYSDTYKTTFTTNTTLYAKFIPTTMAVFTLKGTAQYFYDLNTANSAALASSNKIIVPTVSGTVPAGTYTISSGVTLLVPYDAGYTLYTTVPGITKDIPSGQSAYRTLTLATGVNIKVDGAISVSAHQNKGQPYGGAVTGKYGKIELKKEANITLNSGSFLYCWGYITGAGSVDAMNGSSVYEDFQITCWRGGNCAKDMVNNSQKVFPLAQYAIQNIEARINFYYGSSEIVYTGVTVSYFDPETSAEIIGTTNGLFQLSSGAVLSRWFNASTDRQMYELNGNASIGYVLIDMYANIDSRKYVLPITNNMDITVKSGTMSCNNDFALLPGASITIDKGAKASLGSNCRLYVYDKAEWPEKTTGYNYPNNVAFCKVAYTDTKITTARTYANMADARLNVNGTLEISKALYTTAGGADICSSEGTGLIVLKTAAGTETVTYQAIQESNYVKEYVSIPITPAQLHNADGSYTKTAGAPANTTVNYKNGHWGWKVTWKDSDGTTLKTEYCYTTPSDTWLTSNKPANPSKECKTFSSWSRTDDDTNQERVYTATYSENTYAITYSAGVNGTGTIDGGTKTCGRDFTLSSATFTRTGYTQTGWSITDGGEKAYELGGTYSIDAAQTFYPFWEAIKYTITWKVDGEVTMTEQVAYGDTPSYGSTPEKTSNEQYTYSFSGWTPDIKPVTGEQTYSGSFDATERYYTIRFLNDDETSVLQTKSLQWGADAPTYTEATPTSTKNDGKLRAFRGWAPEIIKVTGNQDCIAQYDVIGILDVPEEQIIAIDASVETTTVHVTGQLKVTEGKTLTTDDLILEATPGTSGEITGTVAATKAYFDFSQPGGFKARTWYAVAVPWQVDVPAYAEGGVYTTNDGETYTRQTLGSTFDLIYYDGSLRAQSGHSDACWKYVEDDGETEIMQPGKAYMIYLASDAKTIRFERKEGAGLLNTTLSVTKYETQTGNGKDASWNGIANPATFHAYINPSADNYEDTENAGQVYDGNSRSYSVINLSTQNLVVGQPVFVQATETKPSVTAYSAHDEAYDAAPRRAKAYSDILRLEVSLAANENEKTDRVIIRANDDKEDTYTVGQDLVKMGASDIVPQMWVDRYDSRLCINTVAPVNGTATYPLSLFAPKADEYTISTNATAENNVTLYLTFDGRPIWNLTYSPYVTSLERGTTQHYGLMLVRSKAPEVATGIGDVQDGGQPAAQKILLNGQVYILRGGELYSITGQSIK